MTMPSSRDPGPPEPDRARSEFDNVLSQQLRDAWALHGKVLTTPDGKRYDVSGWIDGHWPYALRFAGRHDSYYFATLDAVTLGDLPKRVNCELRIAAPDTVWVDRETSSTDAMGGGETP